MNDTTTRTVTTNANHARTVLLVLAAIFVLGAIYFLQEDAPGTFSSGKRLTDMVLCLIGLAVTLSGVGVIDAIQRGNALR